MLLFDPEILKEFKSVKWNKPFDLKLPEDPLAIASNLATLESGETFVIKLHPDGTFWQTDCIDEYHGIKNKIEVLNQARSNGWPIKVEDMENYNAEVRQLVDGLEEELETTVNGHLFIGFENKGSFGWHKDEGHVFCYMISGVKQMETETDTHMLEAGDWLFMPEGLAHCATNIEDSVMISFGTGSIKPRVKELDFWAQAGSLIG